MKVCHLVKIHFDRRKPEITDEWLKDRCQFFAQYTAKSLMNQKNQDWNLWISCGEGVRSHNLEVINLVKTGGRRIFFTYDKNHWPVGPSGVWSSFGETVDDADYVYVTRIDSDDLYSPEALRLARECKPQTFGAVEASMFRRGYMHDIRTFETGVYHGSSTPFHTMMIPGEVFRDPVRYAAMDYGDHSLVNKRYPTQVLPDWNFAVLVHGKNFISDMSYGRERGKGFGVEKDWSIHNFVNPPITFDVDDLRDDWNCIPELDALKEHYPNFRCTAFAIPSKISVNLLAECSKREWLEVGVHGYTHDPNEELKSLTPVELFQKLSNVVGQEHLNRLYAKTFRPPGWFITPQQCHTLSQLGFSVAIHERDERTHGPHCTNGYYVCRPDRHGHYHTSGPGQRAHSVCHNGIRECLPEILKQWPKDQRFMKVSESLLRSV